MNIRQSAFNIFRDNTFANDVAPSITVSVAGISLSGLSSSFLTINNIFFGTRIFGFQSGVSFDASKDRDASGMVFVNTVNSHNAGSAFLNPVANATFINVTSRQNGSAGMYKTLTAPPAPPTSSTEDRSR